MLLIDLERRLCMANCAGGVLLARGDLLFDLDGKVLCRDFESNRRLIGALRVLSIDAIAHRHHRAAQENRAVWVRGAQDRHAALTLQALWSERDDVQILVTVVEPGAAREVDPILLQAAFGLTMAQARLAALIAAGHSPASCAIELGVKTSTVRSHLLALYQKTGAEGRSGLVRVVLSICAP